MRDINMKNAGRIAVLLLAFIQLAYALPSSCSISNAFAPSGEGNWIFLSAVGVLISAAITGILYMIGSAISKPELVSRAKTDFSQVIITLVMIAAFESVVLFMCNMDVKDLGFKTPGTVFDAADSYFNYQYKLASKTYFEASNVIMTLSGLSAVYGGGNIGGVVGIALSPFSGLTVMLQGMQYVMGLTMLQVSISWAQSMILEMIKSSFLEYLLPTGLVLRCFTPTRDIGGIIISIGVGLFLFYPSMFAIAFLVSGENSPDSIELGSSTWANTIIKVSAVMAGEFLFLDPISSTITNIYTVGQIMYPMVSSSVFSLGSLLLYVFILPAINWIIIASLIRDMSRLMGEEVDVSTLARLI